MKNLYLLLGLVIIVASCQTTQEVVVQEPEPPKTVFINTSVPEEGGISFVKYTDEYDNVLGPQIVRNLDQIRWYAPSLIAISPDGAKLAYLARKNNTDNIYIKNTAGGGTTIQRTFRNSVMDMAFSPNGEKIVFTDVYDGGTDIFMINAYQGAAVQQITTSGSSDLGPVFSPEGNEIFFTKGEETYQMVNGVNMPFTRYYVWSYNLETSLLTQYSEGFTPSMSPEGDNLIVTRNSKDDESRGEIWMINITSGQTSLILADNEKGFSSPQISPDGKKIICVGETPETSNRRSNLDIYTINIDGTNLTQITFHPGDDTSPIWSPDGDYAFFISQRGNEQGEWNAWRMNIDK